MRKSRVSIQRCKNNNIHHSDEEQEECQRNKYGTEKWNQEYVSDRYSLFLEANTEPNLQWYCIYKQIKLFIKNNKLVEIKTKIYIYSLKYLKIHVFYCLFN